MNKVTNYFRESYKELMEKVTWPTWSELQQSTVIVLVATLLITAAGRCDGCVFQWCFKIHLFIIILMETINQAVQRSGEQTPQVPAKETKWYVLACGER